MDYAEKQSLYDSADVDQLIRMRLARLYVSGYTYEDLVQEGRLAAWNALDAYNANRGAVRPYLTRVIMHAYGDLISRGRAKKRRPPQPLIVDTALVESVPDHRPNVEDGALIAERGAAVRKAIESARAQLGDAERTVMECYAEPPPELITTIRNLGRRRVSRQALATYLGISTDRLCTLVRHIRKEMAPSLSDVP